MVHVRRHCESMLILVGLGFVEFWFVFSFVVCGLISFLFCLDWKWDANSPLLSVSLSIFMLCAVRVLTVMHCVV
jgi:hypothetical protein